MDKRYKNLLSRIDDDLSIYVEFIDLEEYYEFMNLCNMNNKKYLPVNGQKSIENLRINKRFESYLFEMNFHNNRFSLHVYEKSVLISSRSIVLFYKNEKDLVHKIFRLKIPTYKPKKLKRTLD